MPRNRVKSRHRAGGFVSRVEMRIVGVKEPSDPPPNQSCALGKVTLEPGHDTRENRIDDIIVTKCNVSALRSASSVLRLLSYSLSCLLFAVFRTDYSRVVYASNCGSSSRPQEAGSQSREPSRSSSPAHSGWWGAAISVGHSACDSLWFFLFSHDTHYWGLRAHEGLTRDPLLF